MLLRATSVLTGLLGLSFSLQAAVFDLPDDETTVVGHNLIVYTRHEDTLLDIARNFDLGFSEIADANPDLDPWVPGANKPVLVPNRFLIPDAPQRGIIVNIPEMRLYYFPPLQAGQPRQLVTHPIGIGREGRDTPLGVMRVTEKRKDPSWTPPESVRREHAAAGDILPAVVPPGPENPLGTRAMRLSNPSYLIHGTHRPFGVGLRVSSGCIRLYPEDIEFLYDLVPMNTPVNIVHAPYKAGVQDGQLYLEAHNPLDDLDERHRNNMTPMIEAILKVQDELLSGDEWPAAENIVFNQRGVVTAVGETEVSVADNLWFVHGGLGLRSSPKVLGALGTLNLTEWFWPMRNAARNEIVLGPFQSKEEAEELVTRIREVAGVPVWATQFDKSMF